MWLKYGVTPERTLLTIDDVSSGKTNLTCPYCGGKLTAKKGRIKTHHFAHTDETCSPVARKQVPSLPLYNNFHINLSRQHFQQVKQLWREYCNSSQAIPTVPFKLVLDKVFVYNTLQEGYQFTDLGKIPVGGLPLAAFNEVQEPLILERLNELYFQSKLPLQSQHQNQINLLIYRAQIQRILQLQLYFLKVKIKNQTVYKIGVTRRKMSERLAEIERDLLKFSQSVNLEVLGTWQHRGNIEIYFKYRYYWANYPIGKLTEYYLFQDVQPVLDDLQRMQPKQLHEEELKILHEDYSFA